MEASVNQVSTVGLDLAKTIFLLHGAESTYPTTPFLCSAAKAELDCDTSVTPPTWDLEMMPRCAPAKSRVARVYFKC